MVMRYNYCQISENTAIFKVHNRDIFDRERITHDMSEINSFQMNSKWVNIMHKTGSIKVMNGLVVFTITTGFTIQENQVPEFE